MRNKSTPYFGDFKCIYCRNHVSTDTLLSGVNNRNHCPYCLHSRHLDLFEAGDRLSACKARMEPIGLSLKKNNKKYGERQGELMIIHCCTDCEKLSINRIAADDIADRVYEVFEQSLQLEKVFYQITSQNGINILQASDDDIVQARLFGWGRISVSETNQQMQLSWAD